jgi:hypothetical protein
LDELVRFSPLRDRLTLSRLRLLDAPPLRSERALDDVVFDLEDLVLLMKSLAPRDLLLLIKSLAPRGLLLLVVALLVNPLAPEVFLRLLVPLFRTDDMMIFS